MMRTMLRSAPRHQIAALGLIGLATLSACEKSVDPGNTIIQTRPVESFTRIDVSGGFEVMITGGAADEVKVEAPEGYQSYIHTDFHAGKLQVYVEDRVSSNFSPKRLILTMKSLEGIEASGGCRVTGNGTFQADHMSIDVSGGTHVTLAMETGVLDCGASGGSQLDLSGSADAASENFSGASELHAFTLETTSTTIDASGGSTLDVRAKGSLHVDASGGSVIAYKGRPAIVQTLSGGSKLIDAN